MQARRPEFTPDLFQPLGPSPRVSERVDGTPAGFWRDSWARLGKNRGALVGLAVVVVLMVLAAAGPAFTQHGPYDQDLSRRFAGPSAEHWFGTDGFGRDLWARVWAGARVSLYIAFLAAFLDLAVGVAYGSISGLAGGRIDEVMQRAIEVLNGIPYLVVVVLAMLVFEPGIITITVALAMVGWTFMARLVRARVLQLKEQEFFLAARSLGASRSRLVAKHLIPNSLGPIVVQLMFTVPTAIFFEAFLSFISLGIRPPEASLGALISDEYKHLRFHPYLLWFPAAVLSMLMIGFNLLGDGLRDALDPESRR